KIKFGSVITDSRGSIGGHTLKWSRAGNVLGTKPQPKQEKTARQRAIQANFSTLTKRWWNNLTSTQRDDWRALAAANPRSNIWGDEYPLTGLAYYVKLNQTLHQAGYSNTDTAPADQAVTSPLTATLTATAPATMSLAYTTTPTPTDHIAYLLMTPPLSPGRSTFDGSFFFVAAGTAGQTSPWNIAAAYAARGFTIVAARQYVARLAFLNTDNGALSAAIQASVLAS